MSNTPQRESMRGDFPYRCQTCGVVCESVAELADPEHHDWPVNDDDPLSEDAPPLA